MNALKNVKMVSRADKFLARRQISPPPAQIPGCVPDKSIKKMKQQFSGRRGGSR